MLNDILSQLNPTRPPGVAEAAADFRRIIGRAVALGGSFYLTYHRWATTEQPLAGHPNLPGFLAAKHEHDPAGRFRSEWYRHVSAQVGAVRAQVQ